jgi:hypothetical protein
MSGGVAAIGIGVPTLPNLDQLLSTAVIGIGLAWFGGGVVHLRRHDSLVGRLRSLIADPKEKGSADE